MKISLILFFLLSFSIRLCAQTNTLNGKVIEKRTQLPIPYATIKVSSSHVSVFSNAEGDFSLPNLDNRDTLVISSLGFLPLKVAISSTKTKRFELDENITSLSDVTIKPIDAIAILSRAVKISNASYPATLILEGYYKEYVKRDSFITKYADGMLNYYIQRKSSKFPKITLKIIESRAKLIPVPDDNEKYDALNTFLNIQDQARFTTPMYASPLDSTNFDGYNYKISEIDDNGSALYLIRFEPKKGDENALFEGKIYIDRESSLIVSINYAVAPMSVPFLRSVSIFGNRIAAAGSSINVKYNVSSQGYYLAYLNRIFDIKISGKNYNQINRFRSEFLVTRIQTKDCILFSDGVYTKHNLFKRGNKYQTEFWKNPNLISNTQEEKEFILNEK